jgi:hypothetical protein
MNREGARFGFEPWSPIWSERAVALFKNACSAVSGIHLHLADLVDDATGADNPVKHRGFLL